MPKEISERLLISAPVVFKWRKRYLEAGLEGLNDLPRSGQPRKLSAQKINEILTLTTRRVPREATHWSVRLMAKYAAVTTWQVRQVWAASDLKPDRLKTFKISNDSHFADKVVDVVGLYLITLWCCRLMRKPRSRRWIARNRCCHCARDRSSGVLTITSVMALPASTPLSTS
ncbi:hypothetical protein PchlR47_24730 [Pseudomonas chlororaphis]|nr:hypothetical protein PchlR47_24730 [Pseudomonas chlororaphis]